MVQARSVATVVTLRNEPVVVTFVRAVEALRVVAKYQQFLLEAAWKYPGGFGETKGRGMKNMDIGSNRFADGASDRRLTLLASEGYRTTKAEVDEVEQAFRRECDEDPETIRLVGIYYIQGRLALDIVARGSEAYLHDRVKHWSSLIYRLGDSIPLGHRWSIDAPSFGSDPVVE